MTQVTPQLRGWDLVGPAGVGQRLRGGADDCEGRRADDDRSLLDALHHGALLLPEVSSERRRRAFVARPWGVARLLVTFTPQGGKNDMSTIIPQGGGDVK